MLNKTIRFTAIAATVFAAGLSAASAQTVIKFGHFAADSHPGHLAALRFAERVTARTNGDITFEVSPASQLGSPPDLLEQTVLGVVDMNLPTQGGLQSLEPAFATVMMPYAFRDYDHAHAFVDGPFNSWIAPQLEDKGLVLLSNWEWGFRNATNSTRPINSPSDMEGLVFRTPPEVQLVAAMEAAGASAVQMPFSEFAAALNQGAVDGQENPIGVIFAFKIYELQTHLAVTQHSYNNMVHVVNKATWDGLTVEQQRIIREESFSAGQEMREAVVSAEADQLAFLAGEAGLQITRPDTEAFRSLMEPAYARVAEFAGQDNVDAFFRFLEGTQ